ncbi:prolyl oligopeptidase family serine peptidase [Erysipelatoclostridium sp. An173]|uniref:prolyl oligopeptidase family serine peptidase n=1 Tax=Erysipelatoclostridium sp. An173 TaxID=1965571 RepID=UPI0032084A28
MVKKAKKTLSLLVSAMMVFGLTITPTYAADGIIATGNQKAYVVGDDWGPGVSKTIITLDKTVDPESVQPSDFSVSQGLNGTYSDRTIENAYVSDANGNQVSEASNIVTIEMAINPNEGNPLVWNGNTWRNNWAKPYELNVSLVDGATLTAGDEVITSLNVEPVIDVAGDDMICPQLDGFDIDVYTYGDATLSYALYTPEADDHSNALIIWNHGIGETGTDVKIDLLGNKVTALADDEFQTAMDGAYILVPQRSGGSDVNEAIYQLANKVLAENSDIDPDKVIVGGCSAGGATTMQLLFAHPEFYAAAYPICPATSSASVSDEMIESIKDVPIWFIHALNDTTCDPQANSIPLADRLKKAGAEVHETYFDDVHDTTGRFFDDENGELSLVDTGKPYQYDGHWSWTYFYNNLCQDVNGTNLWNWMAVQDNSNGVVGTQKAYVVGDDWGAGVSKTIISFNKTIDADSVDKDDFEVVQTCNTTVSDRTVLDAYVSNENGDKVTTDSNYVTVEMYISPNEGSPIVWDQPSFSNSWANPYKLDVNLIAGATIASGDVTISTIYVEPTIDVAGDGKICPQIEDFEQGEFAYDNATVQYALYSPEADDHSNALVIWNHGGGEFGYDVEIPLLANKVTALADDEFQDTMNNAYILAPQRQPGTDNDKNAETIYQLVLKLLRENPDIDPNKVIVGGCSAGGLMTMTMLFAHPDLYAGAFPICAAYNPEDATDEMIESIKDVPIWFIHAENDDTVSVDYSKTFESRLEAVGAEVHTSYFADVHDTSGRFDDEDGNPHQYSGHWSWVYFDNNECVDENNLNCWQWISQQTKLDNNVASGSQTAYIIGDDWGPAVSKTIVEFDKVIDSASLNASDFLVTEEKQATVDWGTGEVGIASAQRQVTKVYPSDANGNAVDGDSKYVTIEMYVDPNTGSPFIYNVNSGFNSWCETYRLLIRLNPGEVVTSGGEALTSVDVKADIDVAGDEKIVPQVDGIFDLDQKYTASDGTLYNYATYTPEKDDKQNALVIWLHGAGEGTNNGKNDSYIDLLGNEVTAFASEEFQSEFDGAYVLVPQAATMWMDGGNGVYQNGDLGSIYTESLMEFIKDYVANNPDVDPNRIIIGGCSNGGYMTMEMILTYPDYFAAAFPICEAFQDQYITDAQIEAIKDMPIWFTYAKNDTTVNPTLCAEPTIERLLAAGAQNIHVSAFDDVHDTTGRFVNADGTPYQYNGHWSWIYFDNNECIDGELTAWHWLGQQVKSASSVDTPTDVNKPSTGSGSTTTSTAVKTGDDLSLLGLGVLMALSATTYTVARKRYH